MGGRGAHLNRTNGRMTDLRWHSTGSIQVVIDGQDKKVKILTNNDTRERPGLPTYSNSPNSIYGIVDPETGGLERFRIFDENGKAVADFDYHTKRKEDFFPHRHDLDFENQIKSKRGHGGEHLPISESDNRRFGALIEHLGKKPDTVIGFKTGE